MTMSSEILAGCNEMNIGKSPRTCDKRYADCGRDGLACNKRVRGNKIKREGDFGRKRVNYRRNLRAIDRSGVSCGKPLRREDAKLYRRRWSLQWSTEDFLGRVTDLIVIQTDIKRNSHTNNGTRVHRIWIHFPRQNRHTEAMNPIVNLRNRDRIQVTG
jgi:hypothetical protein